MNYSIDDQVNILNQHESKDELKKGTLMNIDLSNTKQHEGLTVLQSNESDQNRYQVSYHNRAPDDNYVKQLTLK